MDRGTPGRPAATAELETIPRAHAALCRDAALGSGGPTPFDRTFARADTGKVRAGRTDGAVRAVRHDRGARHRRTGLFGAIRAAHRQPQPIAELPGGWRRAVAGGAGQHCRARRDDRLFRRADSLADRSSGRRLRASWPARAPLVAAVMGRLSAAVGQRVLGAGVRHRTGGGRRPLPAAAPAHRGVVDHLGGQQRGIAVRHRYQLCRRRPGYRQQHGHDGRCLRVGGSRRGRCREGVRRVRAQTGRTAGAPVAGGAPGWPTPATRPGSCRCS
ncbi:hypothetical protein LAUMK40_00310 [Mycobacterium kansasii]|nr:hypothetical protein LAUMK40_00310 [Mycobacterium kansasii]